MRIHVWYVPYVYGINMHMVQKINTTSECHVYLVEIQISTGNFGIWQAKYFGASLVDTHVKMKL